jgi:glucan phosphoethanolaminetransferase (alkaline phosphatase superfamily)
MIFIKNENYKFNVSLYFLIFTIFACSLAEIIFLEIKYNIFTGGFLQYNQLISFSERGGFVLLFLFFNTIFYGAIYWVWRWVFNKSKMSETIISFHYLMVMGIGTAITLVVQFELHKYFADAMDLTLLKNLAGGDLKTALAYAMDEVSLFIIGFLILVIFYYIIYKLCKGVLLKYKNIKILDKKNFSIIKRTGLTFSSLVVLGVLIILINKNDRIYFNLIKANSFYIITSVMNFISDVDRDGYGNFKKPWDTDSFDKNISPTALDIPDNGIDEDGYFGDFTGFIAEKNIDLTAVTLKKPKHIIIIVMESMRADAVGKKIDNKLVTPNISAVAMNGKKIEQAYSHTGYTVPSLANIFSGRHGSFGKDLSLFRILKNKGYGLAIFSSQDETWGGNDDKLGMRKVDKFYDAQVGVEKRVFKSKSAMSIRLNEKTLLDEFKNYSNQLNWGKPQFVYFNMQAAHFPYHYPQITHTFIKEAIPRSQINIENKEWLQRTYYNAVFHADIYVGQIIEELKAKNIWDETLLVIVSDHGEELFDNNLLGHGFMISDVQTKITLVINKKDFKVKEPVGQVDLKNYILSYSFGQKNNIFNKEPAVFQMIGILKNPSKISLRYNDKRQIIFDMRNMMVRPIGQKKWISYSAVLKDKSLKNDLKKLIFHWENLRWQSALEDQKNMQ